MFDKLKARIIFVPTLIWNMLLGRWLKVRNWWDRIDETMIVGAMPFEKDVTELAEQGVTCVVNTCAEYDGPTDAYDKSGIQQFHMPTIDFTHPELNDVLAAVEFIKLHVADGGTVYIHCKAGRARSATVALCWLIENKRLTPQQAQALLLEKRPHINRYIYTRPVVQQFVAARNSAEPLGS